MESRLNKNTRSQNHLLLLAKKWQLAIILDIAMIVILICIIFSLINQNFTKIKYVEFGKKDNYSHRILTSSITNKERGLLIKQYLTDYVKYRESYQYGVKIDKRIVEKIRAISSDDIFKSYEGLQKMRDNQATFTGREINILQDIEIESNNSHHIRYKTIDYYGEEAYENEWIIRIDYEFEKHKVKYKNASLNPFGLVITGYKDDTILNNNDILNESN